ncbi:hypothetical protein [Methylobacterium nigriterrae]|uniref:hypothetical protein n=1 Tax=Methylobacterium nigriterrae TaxID=3127512 RepID=UPI00301376EE
MKVKYIFGDEKGEIAHLGFHEAQAALVAKAVEPVRESVPDFPTGSNETDAVEAKKPDDPDYDAMTRPELDKLAAERGVDVSQARNKADVIAALKAA